MPSVTTSGGAGYPAVAFLQWLAEDLRANLGPPVHPNSKPGDRDPYDHNDWNDDSGNVAIESAVFKAPRIIRLERLRSEPIDRDRAEGRPQDHKAPRLA
jgi:hypothetical protein